MALLSPAAQRVTTAAGLPISGGKARIYNVNTTTYSTLYSDASMATPLANPVIADSNGWLPAIFLAEGSYDIAHLTAGDVVLKSWEDWPSYTASGAGEIARTLSGARVSIDGGDIGDGNIGVRYNNGNPDPDAVGGYFRLGGWSGTSADKGIIDAAVLDVVQPKSLKEDAKRLASLLSAEPTTFSAATTVSIALPNDPTGTRGWRIRLFDLVFSSAVANINMRLAYDGVPTYKSGATDYAATTISQAAGSASIAQTNGAAQMGVYGTSSSSTSHPLILDFEIQTPNSGVGDTNVWGKLLGYTANGTAAPTGLSFDFIGKGDYGRATHIGLIPSTGTVSGKYRIEEVRGLGE